MKYFWWGFGIIAFITALVLLTSYICFRMAFYASKKSRTSAAACELPSGAAYEAQREKIKAWMQETRRLPYEEMSICSFDGLRLYAKFYQYSASAPIEILFHGYRSTAERDLSGGVQRCFHLGRSVLVVDQRAAGKSEGNVITFGINERRDCLSWVQHLIQRFGENVKIYLGGISMGAATVVLASGMDLPKNVVGLVADCGYSSAPEMIKKTIKEMHLPVKLLYPFVKLGAKLYGRFDIEEITPLQAVKNCKLPIVFFHGDADDFVPCEMSKLLYEACPSKKKLVIVSGAAHGLCYPVDKDEYVRIIKEFSEE